MVLSGVSLAADSKSAFPTPTYSAKIMSFKLMNGEFDEFYVTQETRSTFECASKPMLWDYNTLIWAKFNGNLVSSNVGEDMQNADYLRIKRRKKNTYNWITLWEFDPRTDPQGWQFTRIDKTAQSLQDYDYAVVPVAGGIEGNLNITPVFSCFSGIYLFEGGDEGKSYYSLLEYDNPVTRKRPTNHITTLGNRFPFVVSNAVVDYETGIMTGIFAPLVQHNTNVDLQENAKYRNEVLEFMSNGTVKLMKQGNGRIWLMQTTGEVSENSYSPTSENDVSQITFEWAEIADATKGHDLYVNDFIKCDIDDISIY